MSEAATIAALEARLRRLEDIEAIRRLKYSYCYHYDRGDFEGFMACFAQDCRVELGLGRRASGRAEVEAMFRRSHTMLQFSSHMVANPLIDVEGDTARGTWYLLLPSTRGGEALWSQARYDEEYVREDGDWKIRSELVTMFFATPFDKGWVKERVQQGLEARYAKLLAAPPAPPAPAG